MIKSNVTKSQRSLDMSNFCKTVHIVSIGPLQIGQWAWPLTVDFKNQLFWIYCISRRNSGLFYSFHSIPTQALQDQSQRLRSPSCRYVHSCIVHSRKFSVPKVTPNKLVKHVGLIHLRASVFVISNFTGQSDFLRFSYNWLRKVKPTTFNVDILTVRFFHSATAYKSILVVCHDSRWLKVPVLFHRPTRFFRTCICHPYTILPLCISLFHTCTFQ